MKAFSLIPFNSGKAGFLLASVFTLICSSLLQAQIGKDWVDRSAVGVTNSREALVYANGLYVAASENAGDVETSTNGDAWTTVSTGLSYGIKSIV